MDAKTKLVTVSVNAKKAMYCPISSQSAGQPVAGSETRVWSPIGTVKPHECAATKVCKSCLKEKSQEQFSNGRYVCKDCRCKAESERRINPVFRQSILDVRFIELLRKLLERPASRMLLTISSRFK